MKNCWITILCCLLTFYAYSEEENLQEDLILSSPDQLATLTSEPSYLVGGIVSPLSGQVVLKATDLVVNGAQNIVLNRMYIPPYIPDTFPNQKNNQQEWDKKFLYEILSKQYKGWTTYPHLRLQLFPQKMIVRVADPSGMTLDFHVGNQTRLVSLPYAISNAMGEIPNGKHDPRNTRIFFEDKGSNIVVHATDGTIRFYKWKKAEHAKDGNFHLYLLAKETLPNGKVLKYQYNERSQLLSIRSYDPQERYEYGVLNFSGSMGEGKQRFTTSTGLSADYTYEKRILNVDLQEKEKKNSVKIKSTYQCPALLTNASSPFYKGEKLSYSNQFLLTSYSGKDNLFTIHYKGFGANSQNRVDELLLPVGEKDAYYPVYKLTYEPPVAGEKGGTTFVKNSDGTSISYHFSKNLLTEAIRYYDAEGILKKEKLFTWNENNWLRAVEVKEANKGHYQKSFEYDAFGNPVLELFTGDLTGIGSFSTHQIKRKFSEDGRHLLLNEETDEGKTLCFTYLPKTNLISSKFTKDQQQILLREFFVYDNCNNLIQTIVDNGDSEDKEDLSNVTQRTITNYLLRQKAPFLHMPEWVEVKYLENGIEKLLNRTHLIYDTFGNVAKEEIYDANNEWAYTLYKEYNERGDLLSETNALGQKATYQYDAKGHLVNTKSFSGRCKKTIAYDTKGRIREQNELGDDGIAHHTSCTYDKLDRCNSKTDSFSQTTYYTYDPLVNKVTKTDFPFVASEDGQAISVATLSTYDAFGRELTKTDANGNTTVYCYNAYGSPTEIVYPDGSTERFQYKKNGVLESHTDRSGLTIQYVHDVLERVLSKVYFSQTREKVAEETFIYDSFNLLSQTDKEGNITHYFYDGAGRKIREEINGRITEYSYDALGQLCTICQHNGDNTLFIQYKRDLEGRILEETKTDAQNTALYKVAYTYDKEGNKETIKRFINGKEAIETFKYDSFSRLIEYVDALGNSTKTKYDEAHFNALGQTVLQKTTIDPLYRATTETFDAFNRLVKAEVLSLDAILSCAEMIYDPQGNLTHKKDHLYANGNYRNSQTVLYKYTPYNQVESITRALGTLDERAISYTYTAGGQVETKTLPDGITLQYSYNPLGFLNKLTSSDGSIHHLFVYDKLGRLKSARDEKQGITIQRELDAFGNVVKESFPNGLWIQKNYDALNRLVYMKTPSQREVHYNYDPLFLRKVTKNLKGKAQHTHLFEEYDESGNLLKEKLGNVAITHVYDLNGQEIALESTHYTQNCSYDAIGNLIRSHVDNADNHYQYDELSQLASEASQEYGNTYAYDSLFNRIMKNEKAIQLNDLNELVTQELKPFAYDLNGNLCQMPSKAFKLTYDPLNRLTEASAEKKRIVFSYDPMGRLMSKVCYEKGFLGWWQSSQDYYLYHGQHEIGAFESADKPKNIRTIGFTKNAKCPSTIAIELKDQLLIPIVDVQGNVRRLLDSNSKLAASYDYTAFGEELSSRESYFNPWRFSSKRWDPDLKLVYFGKRFYDPETARWLTPDPAGFIDSSNLYQYLFNNPFHYMDPNGEFVFVIPFVVPLFEIALPTLAICLPTLTQLGMVAGMALAITAGYEVAKAANNWDQRTLGYTMPTEAVEEAPQTNTKGKRKPGEGYAPDKPLPVDKHGKPIPDVDVPHTQLGTQEGRRGKYRKGREFDELGLPVRDIEFTDHGYPHNHTNPHQHRREENRTGGTRSRENGEPLPGWKY